MADDDEANDEDNFVNPQRGDPLEDRFVLSPAGIPDDE
jgi:hypothetical protein